jgi:hypothetical protein
MQLGFACTPKLLSYLRAPARQEKRASRKDAVEKVCKSVVDQRLKGLGLGPGTDHVSRFYPESIANIPVARFADEIGGLLQRTLLGPGRI